VTPSREEDVTTLRSACKLVALHSHALALACSILLVASCSASRSVTLARPLAAKLDCALPASATDAICSKGAGEPPKVVKIGSPTANGHYRAGQEVRLTVEFTRPVLVRDDAELGLSLETGAVDRRAQYATGSGTNVLEFIYTIQDGDRSDNLDYVATDTKAAENEPSLDSGFSSALSAGLGAITDEAGNDAHLTLPAAGGEGSLGAQKSIVVDTKAPTLTNDNTFRILPATETAYRVFGRCSEDGLVTISGGVQGEAICAEGHYSASLDYGGVPDGAVAIVATMRDLAGNVAAEVETVVIKQTTEPDPGPAQVRAISTSSAGNARLGEGDTLILLVSFSRPVFVHDGEGLGIMLETGATDRLASYAGGSGTDVLQFVYTVEAGDITTDLDYVAASPFSAGSGSIRDSSGNDVDLSLPEPGAESSISAQADIAIDAAAPPAS
jgi:hypothetical protein